MADAPMDVKPLGHDPAQAGFLALGRLGAGHGGLVERGLQGGTAFDAVVSLRGA